MNSQNPTAELAEILARKIPFEMVAESLFRALTATTISRSGAVEQDTRSQLQAASLILENRVGRPVTRQEIISVDLNADAATGIEERLRHSPALQSMMRKMLGRVEEAPAMDV
jgi:hypothetical protein